MVKGNCDRDVSRTYRDELGGQDHKVCGLGVLGDAFNANRQLLRELGDEFGREGKL